MITQLRLIPVCAKRRKTDRIQSRSPGSKKGEKKHPLFLNHRGVLYYGAITQIEIRISKNF